MAEEWIYTSSVTGKTNRFSCFFDAFNSACSNIYIVSIKHIRGDVYKTWVRKTKWDRWHPELEKNLNKDPVYVNSCIVWIELTVVDYKRYAQFEIAQKNIDKAKRRQMDIVKIFLPPSVVKRRILTTDDMEALATEDELYSNRAMVYPPPVDPLGFSLPLRASSTEALSQQALPPASGLLSSGHLPPIVEES